MRRAERPTAKTTTWERRDIDTMKMSPDNVSNTDAVVRQDRVRLSERVTLQPGDKVRVSGGPYWEQIGADGSVTKTRMGERGVMVFEEYCELNESRWIVARGKAGYAALHMGLQERSELLPGLVRRPYKIRKLRPRKTARAKLS